jgi:hypothetical protein
MTADAPFIAPKSIAEWAERLSSVADDLRGLSPEQFCDADSFRYHPCMDNFSHLLSAAMPVANIEEYRPALRRFLDRYPGTKGWLPDRPGDLAGMEMMEVYFRVQSNWADERWVDGAMIEPFETGCLLAALDRLVAESGSLFLSPR